MLLAFHLHDLAQHSITIKLKTLQITYLGPRAINEQTYRANKETQPRQSHAS